MSELTGALYFYDEEPHVFGVLTIGKQTYELVGVRRNKIVTKFTGKKKREPDGQMDLFHERSGDSGK